MDKINLEQALSRCINSDHNEITTQTAIITIRISSSMANMLTARPTIKSLLALRHEQRVATSPNEHLYSHIVL